jgi:hypothetical protein
LDIAKQYVKAYCVEFKISSEILNKMALLDRNLEITIFDGAMETGSFLKNVPPSLCFQNFPCQNSNQTHKILTISIVFKGLFYHNVWKHFPGSYLKRACLNDKNKY